MEKLAHLRLLDLSVPCNLLWGGSVLLPLLCHGCPGFSAFVVLGIVPSPQVEDVDRLAVIHITGTKGKGSTSAFSEALLRARGLKTGMYVSPHLQEVRERIRINGRPIPREMFGRYFYEIWDLLEKNKDLPTEVELPTSHPTYFRFLTLMAFHIFRAERVEATILEVGIGGTYDATNVVSRPVACGIVSIGLDHEAVLGNTIASIAEHKAGIMKENVPAFTDRQLPEAAEVLARFALTLRAPLFLIPALDQYRGYSPATLRLGIPGRHQLSNAALALALTKTWLGFRRGELPTAAQFAEPGFRDSGAPFQLELTAEEAKALEETTWEGRCQVIPLPQSGVRLFVDGAHTLESLTACVAWFRESARPDAPRALVCNFSFDRNPARLLRPLMELHRETPFGQVVFSPNVATLEGSKGDTLNNMAPPNPDLSFQQNLRKAWEEAGCGPATVAPTVTDALQLIATFQGDEKAAMDTDVLITGSLHLVGATLNVVGHEVK